MNLSRHWGPRILLAALFTLTISACFPTSQHPIAGEPMKDLDGTFSGIWEGKVGDGPATLMFMQQSQDDTGTHEIGGLIVGHHEERLSLNEGWLEFAGEISVVQGEVFLSALLNQMDARPTEADERGYYLFRIILSENTMSVIGLNELVTAELVNRGDLEGSVDRSQTTPSVRLTSDPQDLQAFLTTADVEEVFSAPYATFTRRR